MQASTGPLGAALSAPVGCLERLEALGWKLGRLIDVALVPVVFMFGNMRIGHDVVV